MKNNQENTIYDLQQTIENLQNELKRCEDDYADLSDRYAILHEENEKFAKKLENLKAGQSVNPKYALLKSRAVKDGKTFDNLYIMVGDGQKFAPIAIQLVRWNPKQKNLLLAIAKPCEIKRVTLVSDLDNPTRAVVTEAAPAEAASKPVGGDLF